MCRPDTDSNHGPLAYPGLSISLWARDKMWKVSDSWPGVKGAAWAPLWVQGNALVGGPGGRSPPEAPEKRWFWDTILHTKSSSNFLFQHKTRQIMLYIFISKYLYIIFFHLFQFTLCCLWCSCCQWLTGFWI